MNPSSPGGSKPSRTQIWLCAELVAAAMIFLVWRDWHPGPAPVVHVPIDTPSRIATWPLPGATKETLEPGVTHWLTTDTDGTTADFFDFDFGANPRLRWELVDQSEDAAAADVQNDRIRFDRNVAGMTQRLDTTGRGTVLVAWNGAFFGYWPQPGPGLHVAPVIIRGKAYFLKANHRWTFGVKYQNGRPVWRVEFLPDQTAMERDFDYGAGAVQCLIHDGKPLHLEPFPKLGDHFKKMPVPSTPLEAGHIPCFDHMKTCRASIGWSRDNRHLYLLAVKEPDDESSSCVAMINHLPWTGGWTVPDVQHFWIKQGAWCAINSDAGDVLQLAYRSAGGGHELIPPRSSGPVMRMHLDANWTGAPEGPGQGSMMFFFVRQVPSVPVSRTAPIAPTVPIALVHRS